VPTSLVKRIDLDKIYPGFLEPLLELLASCQSKGAAYFLTHGLRTFEEQDRLYAQGRTVPGKKVTNARGGASLHNYGLAVDAVRDADLHSVGLQPAWDRAGYELLWREAQVVKLETGFFWKMADSGHVQLPRPAKFKTDGAWCAALKIIHDAGGLKAVWAHLDATYKK